MVVGNHRAVSIGSLAHSATRFESGKMERTMFITKSAIQGYTPFHIFLVATVALRFLFAWAYHRGGYNILSNMLFHTASNLA